MAASEEFNNVAWDLQQENDNVTHDDLANKEAEEGEMKQAGINPLSDLNQVLDDASSKQVSPEASLNNDEVVSQLESVQIDAHISQVSSSASTPPMDPISQVDNVLSTAPQPTTAPYNLQQDGSTSSPLEAWKSISVTDPRKEMHEQSTFMTYCVKTYKSAVRRRFQDFVWLHNVLYINYPACIIPPLPNKHRMEYVKGDRFSANFVEHRRVSLERFLQRLARHPILGKAEFFILFLESPQFNDASARAVREGQETMIDTLGDSLLNAFTKIRQKDTQFVEMSERAGRLSNHLNALEKTLLRSQKRTQDLCQDYKDFAANIKELAKIETSLTEPLGEVAKGVGQYAERMDKMSEYDELWCGEIHDYMAYHGAMKDVLKLRDQKQLDVEELSEYLNQTIKEREKIMYTGTNGGMYGITGYLAGKFNEVRGADAEKIRREKLLRLDKRIRELRQATEQARQVSTAFSEQVKREDDTMAHSKAVEMYQSLKHYTDAKVDFYQESANIWRTIVKTLEKEEPDV